MTGKLLAAAAVAALVVLAAPTFATEGLPGAKVRTEGGQTAADRKARFEQWCRENPEKCREAKAKAQQRREECKANPEKCRAEEQAQRRERFKRADASGDGRLTREEAKKGMPLVARDFDRIDANQDGGVTLDELEAALKARADARKGKGS